MIAIATEFSNLFHPSEMNPFPIFPILRAGFVFVALAATYASGQEGEKETSPKKEIKMRGLRFPSKGDEEKKEAVVDEAPPKLPEGALAVGVVKGQSKLPPELAKIAQRGASAVAEMKWVKAREAFLELVEKAPDNALAYANLGVAEQQLGNLLAAEGNLNRSVQINPSIAQNWQTLGLVQYERGDIVLAISSLVRAVHEDPADARSRVYLAAVMRDYGWREAALTELERAAQTDPELVDAQFNLAVAYLEESPPRVELARRHYYAALDLGAEASPEIEAILTASPE